MRLRSLYTHRRWIPLTISIVLLAILFIFFRRLPLVQNSVQDVRFTFARLGLWSGNLLSLLGQQEAELRDKIDELQAQLQAHTLDELAYERLEEEHQALQTLLGYGERQSLATVPARVLSRSKERSGDLLLIDRGTEDGLRVGQAVIAEEGIFVGTIIEAEAFSSQVRLATDRQSKIAIQLLGSSNDTFGIAEGSEGAFLRVAYIPQDVSVEVHDLVATSGLDSSIPAGLLVGIVTSVLTNEHDPFQGAYVEPIIDFRRLSYVGVLTISL